MKLLLVLVVALGACASSVQVRTATGWRSCDDPEAHGGVQVLPAGVTPVRSFRIVGPVEARFDVSAAGRVRTLQTRACELGADAVIGWSELGVGGGLVTGQLQGNMLMMSGGGGHVVASGMAIVYTDGPVVLR